MEGQRLLRLGGACAMVAGFLYLAGIPTSALPLVITGESPTALYEAAPFYALIDDRIPLPFLLGGLGFGLAAILALALVPALGAVVGSSSPPVVPWMSAIAYLGLAVARSSRPGSVTTTSSRRSVPRGHFSLDDSFSWASPLGASVALFLVYGVIHVLFGAIYVLAAETDIGSRTLFASPGLDQTLFGAVPADLLRDDRVLAQLRSILYLVIAGLLVGLGIVELSLTWFGLHEGQRWALVALAVSGLVMFPFWVLVFRPYLEAGVPLGLSSIPPWIWVPGGLLIPATVLGWIGLR